MIGEKMLGNDSFFWGGIWGGCFGACEGGGVGLDT